MKIPGGGMWPCAAGVAPGRRGGEPCAAAGALVGVFVGVSVWDASSVASAPLRHVDVRAPQQMVPGEVYVGWLCKNRSCGRVIAIAATAPGGKALTDFDDQLTAIKCPHCGDENLYRWSARSEQKFTSKSVET